MIRESGHQPTVTVFVVIYYFSVQPRENTGRFEATEGISKAVSARIRRLEGAHAVRITMLS